MVKRREIRPVFTINDSENIVTLKNDRLLTSRQLARLLNVHINTIRRWNNQGAIRAYRIGTRGDRRFDRDEVERFLAGKDRLKQ